MPVVRRPGSGVRSCRRLFSAPWPTHVSTSCWRFEPCWSAGCSRSCSCAISPIRFHRRRVSLRHRPGAVVLAERLSRSGVSTPRRPRGLDRGLDGQRLARRPKSPWPRGGDGARLRGVAVGGRCLALCRGGAGARRERDPSAARNFPADVCGDPRADAPRRPLGRPSASPNDRVSERSFFLTPVLRFLSSGSKGLYFPRSRRSHMPHNFMRYSRSFAFASALGLAATGIAAQQAGQAPPTPAGRAGAAGARVGALAPPPIIWAAPPLPDGPILLQSAVPEHRNLRVVVMTKALSHPWGMAFLPDGGILVTERAGTAADRPQRRARPEARRRRARGGAPSGCSGLMDIALHPRFAENKFVYLTYHKPSARGRNGCARHARSRAWHVGRDRADQRAGHLRRRCRGRGVAAGVRPRRDALHEHRQLHRRRQRAGAGSEPLRRQAPAAARRRHACRRTTRSSAEPATSRRSTRWAIATSSGWR